MDTTQLVSEFLASDHGAQALQALGAQGVSDADARDLLSHATGAAVVGIAGPASVIDPNNRIKTGVMVSRRSHLGN